MKHKILMLMFAIIGVISGTVAISNYVSNTRAEADFILLRESVFQEKPLAESGSESSQFTENLVNFTGSDPTDAVHEVVPDGLLKLMDLNPMVIGWVQISGTMIDYPIVQSVEDNEYFLHRDIDGNESYPGSIYMDSNHRMGEFGVHVLYGHNMKDGSMFHDITRYASSDYLNEHTEITLYHQSAIDLEPVYCYQGAADSSYRSRYTTPEEVNTFLKEKTGMDITGNVFVFITCSYNSLDERTYLICIERN